MTPRFKRLPLPDDDQVLLEFLQRLDERPCPMSDQVEGFVTEALSPAESEEVLAHLRQCVVCVSVFARLQSLDAEKVDKPQAVLRGSRYHGALVLEGLLGECAAMIALREQVTSLFTWSSVYSDPSAVLIEGETGTGKSALARAMHRASARRNGPFINVNCAAIPEELLEAELFGFERGAFTGAREARTGYFQQAHHGALFLDEIGVTSLRLLPKLLAAIDDKYVHRVGGTRREPADVWVIAASNEDLERAAYERRFRQDLYRRLARVTLRVPPLRERGSDILLLTEYFLERACREHQLPAKSLSNDARSVLLGYSWPGNVRELENVVESAVLFTNNAVVTSEALEALPLRREPTALPATIKPDLVNAERGRLLAVWREASGSLSRAAALLGIPRNTLRYRLRKLNILPDDQKHQ
jgi:transcriptional regulator with PAS, ATPase and Fis domain